MIKTDYFCKRIINDKKMKKLSKIVKDSQSSTDNRPRIRNLEELKRFVNDRSIHETKDSHLESLKTYEDFLAHSFLYEGDESLEEIDHALGGSTLEELETKINKMIDNAENKIMYNRKF